MTISPKAPSTTKPPANDTTAIAARLRLSATRLARRLRQESDAALLVAACDKLHNASSILADLRTEGDAVWERFTVTDPRTQLWYYTTVAEILRRRMPGPLTDELDRVVREVAAMIT